MQQDDDKQKLADAAKHDAHEAVRVATKDGAREGEREGREEAKEEIDRKDT